MKNIYLTLGIINSVLILILFFQNLATAVQVGFLMATVPFVSFFLILLILSILQGILITLYVKDFARDVTNQSSFELK